MDRETPYINKLDDTELFLYKKYYKHLVRKRIFASSFTSQDTLKRLTKFFNLPDVPFGVKRQIAEDWHGHAAARTWKFRYLQDAELEALAENDPPSRLSEAEAFIANPYAFVTRDNENLLNNAPFVYALMGIKSDSVWIPQQVRGLILKGVIDQGYMNLELALQLVSYNLSFFGNVRDKSVLDWIRNTYSLEEYPDSFVLDFAKTLQETSNE